MILIMGLVLSACSIPKDPRITFGKKCVVKDETVAYSYVWIYSKELGLKADTKSCDQIKRTTNNFHYRRESMKDVFLIVAMLINLNGDVEQKKTLKRISLIL